MWCSFRKVAGGEDQRPGPGIADERADRRGQQVAPGEVGEPESQQEVVDPSRAAPSCCLASAWSCVRDLEAEPVLPPLARGARLAESGVKRNIPGLVVRPW